MSSKKIICSLLVFVILIGASVSMAYYLEFGRPLPAGTAAKFVGRDSCISCHADQNAKFIGSHHDLAMDIASDETVLGDFDNATLEHYGVTSRMFRRDGGYWINTEGPDGKLHDFQIQWVFGVDPLQQYMVDLSGWDFSERTKLVSANLTNTNTDTTNQISGSKNTEDALAEGNHKGSKIAATLGRIHVLRVSWDTQAKRWFYLNPPDSSQKLEPDDPLHWTGVAQRWNTMCADCHSTNVHKRFDASSLAYETHFSEIDVSCEACHGPGSMHVELSQRWLGKTDPEFGNGLVANLKQSAQSQIDACAPCHARRVQVHEEFHAGQPLFDHYTNVLLEENVYFDDGQILDEDYVHGSFLQSKMYHKGIKCSDCHDPHSVRLIRSGNAVCTSCHQHPAAIYDHPAHHHHKPGSEGAMCVNCHMPATMYMAIDSRRDHSFRIPRPDLSLKIGTPNACTGCHLERTELSAQKTAGLNQYLDWMNAAVRGTQEITAVEMKRALQKADQWCDDACNQWYGETRKRPFHFATLLAEVRGHAVPSSVNVDDGNTSGAEAVDADEQREIIIAKLLDFIAKPSSPEAPAIARATAIEELVRFAPESSIKIYDAARGDESELVRRAVTSAVETINDPTQRANIVVGFLNDDSRSVRIEAARIAAVSNREGYSSSASKAFNRAYEEFNTALAINNDRAGAHLTLGSFIEATRRTRNGLLPADLRIAAKHYNDAIRVEPNAVGARKNLAAVFDQLASSAEGEKQQQYQKRARELRVQELEILRRDSQLIPQDAEIRYQLGLLEYLVGDKGEALNQIELAADLEPNQPQYRLSLALILDQNERRDEAIRILEVLIEEWPNFTPAKQLLNSWKQQVAPAEINARR